MVSTVNLLGKGCCEQGGPELPLWGFHFDPLRPRGQAGRRRGWKQLSDRLRSWMLQQEAETWPDTATFLSPASCRRRGVGEGSPAEQH